MSVTADQRSEYDPVPGSDASDSTLNIGPPPLAAVRESLLGGESSCRPILSRIGRGGFGGVAREAALGWARALSFEVTAHCRLAPSAGDGLRRQAIASQAGQQGRG
jgi:hypothetical protein